VSLGLLARQFSFAAILALTTQAIAADGSLGGDGLTAADVIKRMKQAYAGTHSYFDTGMVKEVFIDANGERIVKKPFTTAFVRPDRFRYEFREKSPYLTERRFVIYRNGEELRTHWDVEHDLTLDTLDRAIAAATGVSSESAITVPGMLLPNEITWRRAIRFSKPTRIEDDRLGDIDCFRIVDQFGGALTTFWISKQDSLLRKTYSEKSFEDFRVRRTTTYEPEIGAEIDWGFLDFNPP
jgi:hypothetical protein